MFVVHDVLTETMIGTFDTEAEALQFTLEATDLLNDVGQPLEIYELTDPQDWAFDNLATEIASNKMPVHW